MTTLPLIISGCLQAYSCANSMYSMPHDKQLKLSCTLMTTDTLAPTSSQLSNIALRTVSGACVMSSTVITRECHSYLQLAAAASFKTAHVSCEHPNDDCVSRFSKLQAVVIL